MSTRGEGDVARGAHDTTPARRPSLLNLEYPSLGVVLPVPTEGAGAGGGRRHPDAFMLGAPRVCSRLSPTRRCANLQTRPWTAPGPLLVSQQPATGARASPVDLRLRPWISSSGRWRCRPQPACNFTFNFDLAQPRVRVSYLSTGAHGHRTVGHDIDIKMNPIPSAYIPVVFGLSGKGERRRETHDARRAGGGRWKVWAVSFELRLRV